ncbi:MAG: apolipoprotein N-acyltransferase, partial [Alistipes sp.]|nr:apolipoprotein N-acyltransferase [Alistipes sp.]
SVLHFQREVRTRFPGAMLVTGAITYRQYATEQEAKQSPTWRYRDGVWYDAFNSSVSLDSSARIGIHHKSKLVVGVEKVPYYSWMRELSFLVVDLGGITKPYATDSVRRVYATAARNIPVGGAICYEAIYGEYFTEFVRNGAQVMCVISNDGWWRDTPGYRYLFAYSRLRAIETRRAIARSANTGKSGFINARGDEGQTLGWDRRGVLTDTLHLNTAETFYTRYGDLLGRIGSYVFILSLLYFMAYRIKRKNHIVE